MCTVGAPPPSSAFACRAALAAGWFPCFSRGENRPWTAVFLAPSATGQSGPETESGASFGKQTSLHSGLCRSLAIQSPRSVAVSTAHACTGAEGGSRAAGGTAGSERSTHKLQRPACTSCTPDAGLSSCSPPAPPRPVPLRALRPPWAPSRARSLRKLPAGSRIHLSPLSSY